MYTVKTKSTPQMTMEAMVWVLSKLVVHVIPCWKFRAEQRVSSRNATFRKLKAALATMGLRTMLDPGVFKVSKYLS